MVLKAPVEIEIEKSKDGLGLNIKGGLDRPFIEVRDPGDLLELTDQCQEEEWVLRSLMKEDTGIFVSNIRESGAVAEVRIFSFKSLNFARNSENIKYQNSAYQNLYRYQTMFECWRQINFNQWSIT